MFFFLLSLYGRMLLAGTGVFYFYFIEWIEAYIGRCFKRQMIITEQYRECYSRQHAAPRRCMRHLQQANKVLQAS
ncbi:hypothetical protein V8C40DRAFT_256123 [Trichoderma camerunense]